VDFVDAFARQGAVLQAAFVDPFLHGDVRPCDSEQGSSPDYAATCGVRKQSK
jgi:hypothetical protein